MAPMLYLLSSAHATPPGFWELVLHSNLINVLLVAFFLAWVASRFKLGSFIDSDKQAIESDFINAESIRTGASEQFLALQQRDNNFPQEVKQRKADSERRIQSLASTIAQRAEVEQAQIEKQLERDKQQLSQQSQASVFEETSLRLLTEFKERLEEPLRNSSLHQRLIDQAIERLQHTPAASFTPISRKDVG